MSSSESQTDSNPTEEQQIQTNNQKNSTSVVVQNNCERTASDVMVVYEYENEDTNDDYDLALDGFILSDCSQYLYKFSIILLPLMLLLVILTAIFSSESTKGLKCKIGRVFIVLGISVGFLVFYMLIRYVLHITSRYRENRRRQLHRQNSQLGPNGLNSNKISKKQLKFLLQNPWHRVTENEPKDKYSNNVNVYVENGLYATNDIV